MEMAVIGKEDFCLGFRLSGIKRIFETTQPTEAIKKANHDPETGIVIFDESLIATLDADEKTALEDSIRPIYINLSTKSSEDHLKKMIRKSIGVDL